MGIGSETTIDEVGSKRRWDKLPVYTGCAVGLKSSYWINALSSTRTFKKHGNSVVELLGHIQGMTYIIFLTLLNKLLAVMKAN